MPMFVSSRKVQGFGTSLAITLPAIFVKVNEVEKGSIGKVYHGLDGVLIFSLITDPQALKESLVELVEKINESKEMQEN